MRTGTCWTKAYFVLCALTAGSAISTQAEDLPPDVLLIAHTIQTNKALMSHLPQYTCLETITRAQPVRGHHKARQQDVIQVDVGIGANVELYSWPGEPTFSSKDIFTLVGHGMLSNGIFRSFAHDLFVANVGIIKLAGEGPLDGKNTDHFTFTLPTLAKTWIVNWLGAQGTVGEQGEFWVDASDLTLRRLDVTAKDIPLNIPLQSLTISIEYRALFATAGSVSIPQSAVLNALEVNGTLHQETVNFSHCRTFQAESKLVTTDSPSNELDQEIKHYEAHKEILPAALLLPVALDTPIQTRTVSVGDRISAILLNSVKVPNHESIPKGALLSGRIREFQRLDDPPNTSVLGLEFDELSWPGHAATFFGSILSVGSLPGMKLGLTADYNEQFNRGSITTTRTITAVEIPGVASLFLQGLDMNIPRGFRMVWQTNPISHP